MPHLRRTIFFVVNHDFAVAEHDVACVITAFVAEDRHAAGFAAALEKIRDGAIFRRQIGITVQHKKFITEQRQGAFDGTARAEQLGAVKRIIQPHAGRRTVAEVALNHLAEVSDAQHRAPDAARTQQFKLMREEWFPGNHDQGFGNFFGDGPEPRRESARENGNGNVGRRGHEMMSLVPSKSKRKRTSLSPACCIARRSLALSSA